MHVGLDCNKYLCTHYQTGSQVLRLCTLTSRLKFTHDDAGTVDVANVVLGNSLDARGIGAASVHRMHIQAVSSSQLYANKILETTEQKKNFECDANDMSFRVKLHFYCTVAIHTNYNTSYC